MVNTNQIASCKHCGGEAEIIVRQHPSGTVYRICCMACGITTATRKNKEQLIDVWNRRVDSNLELADDTLKEKLTEYGEMKARLSAAKEEMGYIATTRDICKVCRYGCKENRTHCAKFEWRG